MTNLDQLLIVLGSLFLVGLLTDLLGRHTPLPRVTLLILFGVLIGPSGLNLLPDMHNDWFPLIAQMALVMVGFLVGGSLTLATLRQHGRAVLVVSLAVVVCTAVLVLGGSLLAGVPLPAALLLAGIATSTAPAATVDVVRESRADGPFTRTLLGVVAIDDAWGLMLFSIILVLASLLLGNTDPTSVSLKIVWEIGGALLLGTVLGVPMAYLTGRIAPGEPTQAEALGIVLLGGGLALWLDVSLLLTAMMIGAVVTNLAKHHSRPFAAIEGIEWPFMILFFVMSGVSLQLDALTAIGIASLAYIVGRTLGRISGGWVSSYLCGPERDYCRKIGIALLPQAGVALGMALLAIQHFPDYADLILPIVVSAAIIFEIFGPVVTRAALRSVGETKQT